jgi:hypothetical protein
MPDELNTDNQPESGIPTGTRNEVWHRKHRMPDNPSLDLRVAWHIEHARRCPCPANDVDLLPELEKRYLGTHQDFWIRHNIDDHRALGLWAAECAEHLLPNFEVKYLQDRRPRLAILALREWVYTGKFSMPVIRGAALGAHAAAKLVDPKDQDAIFAAHAAGQAVGTAHVPTHALGVVLYSIKLVASIHPQEVKTAVADEKEWQDQRLPENLQPWVNGWLGKTLKLLQKDLRKQLE